MCLTTQQARKKKGAVMSMDTEVIGNGDDKSVRGMDNFYKEHAR